MRIRITGQKFVKRVVPVVNTRGYREIILIFSLDLKSIFVYKQFD